MSETAQPDPQVVAWMHRHRASLGHMEPNAARTETVKAYRKACPEDARLRGLRELVDTYNEAARKPLTVADIPAGQGPASLFLTRHEDGGPALWFKAHDGRLAPVSIDGARYRTEVRAMWDHLAATLPTVTNEESP